MNRPVKTALTETRFQFPGQTAFYKGKVRDVYTINNELLIMVASDRISAFDVVLPKGIPCKGQVLNQVAGYFLENTRDVAPNWLIAQPDPIVSIGYLCDPVKVEMVIRGYLAGHSAREYKLGKRSLCGVEMPEGMKENQIFPTPIITPTTKAEAGHDEDISKEAILANKLVPASEYAIMEDYTRKLFAKGTAMAASQDLILVDTKYEFGLREGKVVLMDEIHTPDSSRYFIQSSYAQTFDKGEAPKQLSKEFVRQWLIENGFQGKEGQVVPEMSDAWVQTISDRYIELYEQVTGRKFVPAPNEDIASRVENNILNWLNSNYK
jgi:phosphoribosylaminoimidazole-succinocarboxamide synthase